jgi:hypothetical protein
MRAVSESLAGRVGIVELTPFLAGELEGRRPAADRWFWGGFPPVHDLRDADARGEWLGASVDHHSLAGLRQCMKDLGLRRGGVVTSSREGRALSPGIDLVPWERVVSGEVALF